MLSHIIPCCRKDKNKRDYIESLRSLHGDLNNSDATIKQIEEQIGFDKVKAPATEAKNKHYSEFRINENQVGITSIALPEFSPSKQLRQKLRSLSNYH